MPAKQFIFRVSAGISYVIHMVCSFLLQINYVFDDFDHPIENYNSFSLAILLGVRL